jgi:hypothetical protein
MSNDITGFLMISGDRKGYSWMSYDRKGILSENK